MGKKTGRKAIYVVYGGKEVVDIVNGHMLGISFNEGKMVIVTVEEVEGRTA